MNTQRFTSATSAGAKNSLEPTTATVLDGVANDLEAQLARMLDRVPPIITLPKPKQKCAYTGMSRTCLLELIAPCERNGHKPPVRAIYRRSHKYAVRGKWHIPSENLFRHLLSLEADSAATYRRLSFERKQVGVSK